jgi:putative membrane protein
MGLLVYLFTTMLHTGALGALMTFSSNVWYGFYGTSALRWGLSALEDQQLGGLIMWVPGGAVYLVVGLALAGRAVMDSTDRKTPAISLTS